MPPQTSFSKTTAIIIAAAVLIVGLAAGYYYGNAKGKAKAWEEGKAAGISQERKAQEDLLKKAAGGQVVNPAEYLPETNPLKEVKTNPYEGAYKNPFK